MKGLEVPRKEKREEQNMGERERGREGEGGREGMDTSLNRAHHFTSVPTHK